MNVNKKWDLPIALLTIIGLAILMFAPLPCFAQTTRMYSMSQTAASGAEPTLSTDGVDITAAYGWALWVCGVDGNITGVGSAQVYSWDDAVSEDPWAKNLDLTINVQAASNGEKCTKLADRRVEVPVGRLYVRSVGITPSVGTDVKFYIRVYVRTVR